MHHGRLQFIYKQTQKLVFILHRVDLLLNPQCTIMFLCIQDGCRLHTVCAVNNEKVLVFLSSLSVSLYGVASRSDNLLSVL